LHPCPQESVDKRPHLHMSVNGVRAWMLNIQVQISGEGPQGEVENKQQIPVI